MTKRSLLLVDGDAKSLRVLEVSLRKAGFTVSTADSGPAALTLLQRMSPDLVISDTDLPEMDGYAFCREFKANPKWKNLPFIFLTGQTEIAHKIRGLELGVDDYLTKPIYIKEILTRVRILLQKHDRAQFEQKKDSNTRFAGQLSDMGVIDLIQTIEVSRKTGVIHFRADEKRQATIFFKEGRVIDAEAGHLQGEDAVYRLLTWNEGEFEALFRSVRRKALIEMSSQSLLMEGMRRLDEWGRLQEQLPPLDKKFQVVYDELWDSLAELPDDVNQILRLFDTRRTLQEVIDGSEIGDLETVEVISKLYFEGLIVEASPDKGLQSGSYSVEELMLQAQAAAAESASKPDLAVVERELFEATVRDVGPPMALKGATQEASATDEDGLSGLLEQAITDATLMTDAQGKGKASTQRTTAKGQPVAPLPPAEQTDSELTEATMDRPGSPFPRPKTKPMAKLTPKSELDAAARHAEKLADSVTSPVEDSAAKARDADLQASSITVPVSEAVSLAKKADTEAAAQDEKSAAAQAHRGQVHTVETDAIPFQVIDDERENLSITAVTKAAAKAARGASKESVGEEYEADLDDLGDEGGADKDTVKVMPVSSEAPITAQGSIRVVLPEDSDTDSSSVLDRANDRDDDAREVEANSPIIWYAVAAMAAGLLGYIAVKNLGGGTGEASSGAVVVSAPDAQVPRMPVSSMDASLPAALIVDAAAPTSAIDARPMRRSVDASTRKTPPPRVVFDAGRSVVVKATPDARASTSTPDPAQPPSAADKIKTLQRAARRARRSGDRLSAIALIDEALELRRSSTSLYLKADLLLDLGDSAAALVVAKELTRAAPKRSQGFRILGLASYESKDYSAARKAFTRYLELAPNAKDAADVRTLLDSL